MSISSAGVGKWELFRIKKVKLIDSEINCCQIRLV